MTAPGTGLLYDLESRPPWPVLLIAGTQHLLAMFPGVVMVPLIVARALGATPGDSLQLVTMAILVSGVATILQVCRLGPVGSGYLCVMGSSGLFIQPAIAAGRAGGLPLVFGMALLLSPLEAVMSRLTRVLRTLSPPHVTGTIILLVGFSIVPLSVEQLAGGRGAPGFGSWTSLVLGLFTVAVIVGAAASRRPMLRIASVVVGVLAGSALAALFGMADMARVGAAPWLSLPRPLWAGLDFDPAFILPFAIAYFATSLETFGDIHAVGEISEGTLGQVSDRRVAGGLLADAIGSCLAGLCGTTPNTTYSGNIAMVQLTGVASRRVGVFVGACLVALSLTPKLAAVIGAMPPPVIGGAMVVAVAILIGVGMRIAMGGEASNTKLLVVGLSVAVGLGVQTVPAVVDQAPACLKPMLQSSTCLGALCAILLNAVLTRLGRQDAPASPSPR